MQALRMGHSPQKVPTPMAQKAKAVRKVRASPATVRPHWLSRKG